MSAGEIVSIILAVGFLVIAFSIVLVSVYFIKALKSLTSLADSLQNTTEDIRAKIQNKFIAAVPTLLLALLGRLFGRILKRGR